MTGGEKRENGKVRHVRIARVITRLNIGGPSIQAVTLTERLSARGHDTLLIHGSLSDGEGDMFSNRTLMPFRGYMYFVK